MLKQQVHKNTLCLYERKQVRQKGIVRESDCGIVLMKLVEMMKKQVYKPQPVKRVYIPKDGTDEMRPLRIPTFKDKLLQDVIREILSEVYEPIFLDFSYRFGQRRSYYNALRALNYIIVTGKVNYIVDANIKGSFDNVDHDWM